MKKLALAAALVFGASPAFATPLLIDDFTAGDGPITDSVVDGAGVVSSTLGGMLTGERDIYVELLSSDGGLVTEAVAGVGGGMFEFSTTSGEGGTSKIQWDGADGGGAITSAVGSGILLDLITDDYTSGAMNNAFEVFIEFADAGFTFLINTWDVGGVGFNSASFVSVGGTDYTETLSFGDAQFAGVNFAAIDAMEIVIDPAGAFTSLDLSLGNVQTVPEPAPLAAIGLGLLAMGWVKRKAAK